MTRDGRVAGIHVAPESGAAMESRERAEAVAGRGLRGDRYFERAGSWNGEAGRDLPPADRALTLIEAEALEHVEREAGIDLPPGAHRRNVVTRGVAVDHLVGERFRVGGAVCEGVDLCEPCGYLERLTEDGVYDALVHRGGLNVRIVETGEIAVGDPVAVGNAESGSGSGSGSGPGSGSDPESRAPETG